MVAFVCGGASGPYKLGLEWDFCFHLTQRHGGGSWHSGIGIVMDAASETHELALEWGLWVMEFLGSRVSISSGARVVVKRWKFALRLLDDLRCFYMISK